MKTLWDMVASGEIKLTALSGDAEVAEETIQAAEDDGADVDTSETTETETPKEEESEVNVDVDVTVNESGEEVVGEDETEETTETDEASAELETELLNVEEQSNQIEDVEEQIEKGEEAVVALESLLHNVILSKETNSFTPIQADVVNQYMGYVASNLGFPETAITTVDVSTESFSTAAGASLSAETAMESVKNFGKAVVEAILKSIAYVADLLKQLYVSVFGNFEKLRKYAAKLKAELSAVQGSAGGKARAAGFANALEIEGTVKDGVTVAATFAEAVNEVASNWAPEKLGTSLSNFAKELGKVNTEQVTEETLKFIYEFTVSMSIRGNAKAFMPFTSNSMSAEEVEKVFGKELKEGETAFASKPLPRNQRVLVILTNGDNLDNDYKKAGRIYAKLLPTSNKEGKKEIEVDILNKGQAASVLNAVESALAKADALHAKLKRVDVVNGTLKGIIAGANMRKLFASTVETVKRDKEKVMSNRIKDSLTYLRAAQASLHEPGASMIKYIMFEAKSLLDYVNWSIKHGKKSGNEMKALPSA